MAASLVALTLGASRIGEPDAVAAGWWGLAAAAFGLFVWRQTRAADPLLPRAMFRARALVAANVAHLPVGAALIVEGCLDDGLARAFGDALMGEGGRGLVARMVVKPYVGVARARDMLVNVALPFLHAYGVAGGIGQGSGDEGALARAALDAYAVAPKLQENEITREMRRLCGIDARARLTARRQQGLMQLYRTGVMGAARVWE